VPQTAHVNDRTRPVEAFVPAGRKVRLPGRGTTYVREAPGPTGAPTLVLLHGLYATTAINWPRAFDVLGSSFRVVALDHRGHGRGIRSARPFRLQDCADDVIALADALGVERVIPVGYSMGGPVALFAAKRHPDRVGGMVLCATSAVFGDGTAARSTFGDMFRVGLRLTPSVMRRQMVATMLQATGAYDRLPPLLVEEARRHDVAALVEARDAVQRFDARPWLGALGVPAASVVTLGDRLVPASRQLELAVATRATVIRVDADHDVGMRNPGLFLPALLEACTDVARRSAAPAR
jgi:3-oxoadipate enol-lactonase